MRNLMLLAALPIMTAFVAAPANAEVLQYNVDVTLKSGASCSGYLLVDTAVDDGGTDIFLNAVTEANLLVTETGGTAKTLSMRAATFIPGLGTDVNSLTFSPDFGSQTPSEFDPGTFGLASDYTGAFVQFNLFMQDESGNDVDLFIALACPDGSNGDGLPTQTPTAPCLGTGSQNPTDSLSESDYQPATFTIGTDQPVDEQIDGLIDDVLDLYAAGDLPLGAAVQVAVPLLFAEYFYDQGALIPAYWQLNRARRSVRRQVRRGVVAAEVGEPLQESIEATMTSLLEEIFG